MTSWALPHSASPPREVAPGRAVSRRVAKSVSPPRNWSAPSSPPSAPIKSTPTRGPGGDTLMMIMLRGQARPLLIGGNLVFGVPECVVLLQPDHEPAEYLVGMLSRAARVWNA